MTLVLVLSAVTLYGVFAVAMRYRRDMAVLRRLDHLMAGCTSGERIEVCRILAASLTQGACSVPPEGPLSGSGAAQEMADLTRR
ncbi:hypothetical protein [Streptomyces sp. NPDC007100]|uniref:hypothetical protein n=1 Tax=unclassified Streptomyces TaxID=2593676 RepID=UPI0034005972